MLQKRVGVWSCVSYNSRQHFGRLKRRQRSKQPLPWNIVTRLGVFVLILLAAVPLPDSKASTGDLTGTVVPSKRKVDFGWSLRCLYLCVVCRQPVRRRRRDTRVDLL